MASGRIRRSARRGIAAAVLGWLAVAAFSVLMAPSASAAPSATVTIQNVTPPAVSVDKGGTVTFVNGIPAQNKGGVVVPLVGTFSATVYTDVSVTFFGEKRDLQYGKSTAWTFDQPATTGTLTFTYRIVPQSGLAAAVANQVVDAVAATLPALPAPTPYVVQTIVPSLPNLPGVNVPQLPTVTVPLPDPTGTVPPPPVDPTDPTQPTVPGQPARRRPGDRRAPRVTSTPTTSVVAPRTSRRSTRWPRRPSTRRGSPCPGRASAVWTAGTPARDGSGGQPGNYDGASVPVFGQLAGLDSAALDEEAAADSAAADGTAPALPAAALAAVVALAAVTAALVRTHQAQRASR